MEPRDARIVWMPRAAALVLAVGALARGAAAEPAEPAVEAPEPVREALVDAARGLAAKGYPEEMRELFDLAVDLGAPDEDVEKERARAERRVRMVRKPSTRIADVVERVEEAVAGLAAGLPDADAEQRRALAEIVLALDSDHAAAREALGHVRGAGGWVPAHVAECLERRAAVDRALVDARRLDVPVAMSDSDSPLLLALYGERGRAARWGRVSVHAVGVPDEKLQRVLRETVRAAALGRFLLTGRLTLPVVGNDCAIDWLDATPRYAEAVGWCEKTGLMGKADADFKRTLRSFVYGTGRRVCAPRPEARMQTILLEDVWTEAVWSDGRHDPQDNLKAGHLNWLCLSYLGAGLPSYGWQETKDAVRGTSDLDADARKRHEMWRLAEAGLLGSRSWLTYLTELGEDPAWSRTFVSEMGMLTGDDLLKATFVTQYLHELGRLDDVLRATDGKPPEAAVFEQAVDGPLADFEQRWRDWLLAPDRRVGFLQRLRGAAPEPAAPEPTAAEQDLLDYLHGLRQAAVPGNVRADVVPLTLDVELSAGCRSHAEYLAQHPEQAAAWPDAHEEWPDREGFSPAGSWAGLHSVIAPGSRSPRDAVDGWMATFYHRLPLLDPGLVRIGWGFEAGMAVLDSGSMVAPFEYVTEAMWPPPRGQGVPCGFAPELPNPVPGEDQSAWGYPVTLQLFRQEAEPDLTMTLHEGRGAGGPVVDCHWSTPAAPTNPELAPGGAYCLIPKARLKPDTTYTVIVRGLPDEDDLRWSFSTGR